MIIADNSSKFLPIIKEIPETDSPYFLFDLDIFKDNCLTFKRLLPEVKLLYAVKAFYSRETIRIADEVVDGFDIASPQEAEDILEWGVGADRLEVSNPVKSEKAIQQFADGGIQSFTVQSKDEIDKIHKIHKSAKITVRIKVNDGYSLVPLSDKFGCDPFYAPELLQYAQNKGLMARGVSFHVGSQLLDLKYWKSAIHLANDIIHTSRQNGVRANNVNIGGGFCAKYFNTDPSIEDTAKEINKLLDTSINYCAEPGRYLVASAAVTISSVIAVERRREENWVFIDTGRFHTFLGADRYEIFPYIPIVLAKKTKDIKKHEQSLSAVLTGPTCDSQDIVTNDILLPISISPGDILVFPNTGAYTIVYGSNFNGFKPPRVINIQNGKVKA